MSKLSEEMRYRTLMRQANAAKREAEELAAGFHIAWGLGGEPSPASVARYEAVCVRAEQLFLEASVVERALAQ